MELITLSVGSCRLGLRTLASAFVVTLLSTPARGDDLAAALAMPLSPGSLALLGVQKLTPAARDRLVTGLKDPRADVRAASARVITVTGVTTVVGNLQEALLVEQDPAVAAELVVALAVLGGPSVDEPLLAAAKRLGGGVANAVADALARTRGQAALLHLGRLYDAGWSADPAFVAVATRDGTENLSLVGSNALERSDAALWSLVLRAARQPRAALDALELVAALNATNDAIRESTYWHLALVLAAKGTLEPNVRAAADAALGQPSPNDPAAAFSLELLARFLGRKPVEQAAWMSVLDQKERPAPYQYELSLHPGLRRQLTAAELASLERSMSRGDSKSSKRGPVDGTRGPAFDSWPTVGSGLRTVDGFPSGFVASVLDVTGCHAAAAEGVAAADISYRLDGRPQTITLIRPDAKPLGTPPACQRAADLLLVTGLARRGQVVKPDTKETVLVVLSKSALSCLAESDATKADRAAGQGGAREQPVGGRIQEPKKLKNVPPIYPSAAKQSGTQGLVIVEAVISPSGCVRHLAVLRSIPALDWAALRAVAEWQYTPTLLNGVPVPVIMTVTVNFRLN